MVMKSPRFSIRPPAVIRAGDHVDTDGAGPGNTGLAHAAGEPRRRGWSSRHAWSGCLQRHACRECLPGWFERAPGLPCACLSPACSASSEVKTMAPLAAPARREAPREHHALRLGVDRGMKQLVKGGRIDPLDGFLTGDQPSLARSTAIRSAALAVRLPLRVCKHPELALLDREFEVLHVTIMLLEQTIERTSSE